MSFRGRRGFTLIEVMVALSIMVMVVTVAFSGLRTGLNTWERGSKAIDDLDQRTVVERLLKRQLAQAFPSEFTIDEKTIIMFRGSGQRIEFVSDYSTSDGPSDFRKIDYAFVEGAFRYSEKPVFGYLPSEFEAPPTDRLAAFAQVKFRYLGVDEQKALAWLDEWALGKSLPQAVQVQIDQDILVIPLVNHGQ